MGMNQRTTEEVVRNIQYKAELWANTRPRFSFWLLFKVVFLTLRGKRIKRINFFPPYTIELENSIS